jgi:hypothetical protein
MAMLPAAVFAGASVNVRAQINKIIITIFFIIHLRRIIVRKQF